MYSDDELVERALAGDGEAWQEWDDRFRRALASQTARLKRRRPFFWRSRL
jgi:hypothetical protein